MTSSQFVPSGDEPVLVSMLNDYLFCSRRAALKGIEGMWEGSACVVQSAHERTDNHEVEGRSEGVQEAADVVVAAVEDGFDQAC